MMGWDLLCRWVSLRRKIVYHCQRCGHSFATPGRCPIDGVPLQRADY